MGEGETGYLFIKILLICQHMLYCFTIILNLHIGTMTECYD